MQDFVDKRFVKTAPERDFLNLISTNNEEALRKLTTRELAEIVAKVLTNTTVPIAKFSSEDTGPFDKENEILSAWHSLINAQHRANRAANESVELAENSRELLRSFMRFMWHCSSPRKDYLQYVQELFDHYVQAMQSAEPAAKQIAVARVEGLLQGIADVDQSWSEELREKYLPPATKEE